jgi:hypothetical protein
LPNEQPIEVPKAVVQWSRGQEVAVENDTIERRTYTRKVAIRLLITTWSITNLGVQGDGVVTTNSFGEVMNEFDLVAIQDMNGRFHSGRPEALAPLSGSC